MIGWLVRRHRRRRARHMSSICCRERLRHAHLSRRPSVRDSFDYAIVRVVPLVERGELINVGVIVSCPTRSFLAARIAFDPARLLALSPSTDASEVAEALAVIPLIA